MDARFQPRFSLSDLKKIISTVVSYAFTVDDKPRPIIRPKIELPVTPLLDFKGALPKYRATIFAAYKFLYIDPFCFACLYWS